MGSRRVYAEKPLSTSSPSAQRAPTAAPRPGPLSMLGNTVLRSVLQPAIQRTLTITNYNTTGAGAQQNYPLNVQNVSAAITQKVSVAEGRAAILARLNQFDGANGSYDSVALLVDALCQGPQNTPAHKQSVADAIGSTMVNENENEAEQFDKLIQNTAAGGSLSRAKGTPCTVTKAGVKGAAGVSIDPIIAEIRRVDSTAQGDANNADLQNIRLSPLSSWLTLLCAGDKPQIRTAHKNGAGWLTATGYAAPFGVLKGQMTAWSNNAANMQTLNGQTDQEKRASIFFAALPNADDRRQFLWSIYADIVGKTQFIEFGVPGQKDGRVVFDFMNQTYYYTVHYNWHKGYNPFFQITDA